MGRECSILILLLLIKVSSQCENNDFTCRGGKCLSRVKVCDGIFDCEDGDDEENCKEGFKCSSPTWFQCNNGQCISSLLFCDGNYDCKDHSDEPFGCSADDHFARSNVQTTCSTNEFTCLNKDCILKTWVCDETPDCLDGSDETVGCGSQLPCQDGFRCKNNHCIVKEFHCDGDNDCGDGSDEVNCTIKFHSVDHCTEDLGQFLCKDNIVCIDMDHVCDGFPHCFDKSDENNCMAGPQPNSTYCKAFGCSHDCHLAPDKKTICTCPHYYKLDSSLKQCIDINECEEFGHCYQKCQNLIEGFKCSCDDGYTLMPDNRTCKAKGGEPLLLFASFNQIRGMYLKSGIYFSLSTQPNRVIGISHNGKYIYWTEINKAEASIMRSEEDGSNRIVIVNSGLGLPEDLVVDYVTGNIYFTDVEKKHIGVCTDNGICTVLHNENIDKPRAIALYPQKGIMFWTDWGKIPKIATSGMDGSHPKVVLDKNLEWPNGLTLDTSNERLYWVDAKALTIETVKLDGSDRRIVLSESVRHPFSIAVFEDMLYWSDWENIQIEKCNKFTGKNHTAVIREKIHKDDKNKHTVYGVHIYHPALHPRVDNPCQAHVCSDLCLLSPNNTYKCACREDFALGPDLHTCRRRSKSLQVAVAGRTHLSFISPRLLGKQFETRRNLEDAVGFIECMAYDSISGNIIISDTMKKKIFRFSMRTRILTVLVSSEIGKITSMSFDSYGNNLYMGDEERMRVEVLSMTTKYSLPVYKVHGGDILQSVVVVPEHGVFFVAVATTSDSVAISRINMDGTQIMPHITGSKIIGPKVMLTYDKSTQKILWFDSGAEIIESMNIDGSHRQMLQITEGTPLSMAVQDKALMWINYKSTNLYFYDTTEEKMSFNNKNVIKLNEEGDPPRSLIVITEFESQSLHPCQNQSKHGCSHICLVTANNHGVCACPLGMHLTFDNRTCVNPAHCSENQFKCRSDDICISRIHRCDGHKDCPSNDDEQDCEINNCKENQFKCANGQCIALHERCDHEFDCSDHSDEINCPFHCKSSGESFQCGSGECIPRLWRCDLAKDCKDGSDENNCGEKSCPPNMFRCKNGMCISAGWECDGDIDCVDASDEDEHCVVTCSPTEFQCGTGRCVSLKFMCDGENDCGDNSDELNCKVKDKEPKCGFDELLCSKAHPKCVPQKSRCNGTAECPRGEDEMDCANCLPTEFQCKNFKCIFHKWLCDKTNDCGDNSDEDPLLCAHEFGSVGKAQPCQDFSCKSGECLPMHLVCNGHKDCEDGSDEGGNCENVCKSSPCDHICLPTPVSARCSCHPGYLLSSNGQKCNDVDECAEEKCSQICQNTPGGFNCSCLDGYLLKSDRMTCKAEGGRMSFVLSGDDEIRKVSYNFNQMDLLVFDAGAQILGLDVDTRKNQIYWSSGSSNKISLLDMASGQKTYIETTDRPGKLSYDWLTGNVYYIDNSSPNSIKVCNLVTRKRATLLTVGPGIVISNLVVEPISGAVFYSQVRSSAFQRPVSEIFKYTFTDQNSTVLVTSDVSWVSGLVVDPVRRFVYWSDLYYQVIEKVKFDGNQRQIVFQSQVRRPESLVLFEDSLVWLTRGSGEIKKCILHGEHKGFCDTIALYIYDIKFVTIMQEVRQPNGTNPCLDKCDQYSICVSTSMGPKCLCEDGTILLPNTSCQYTNTKPLSGGRSLEENSKSFLVSQEPQSSSSTSTVVAILVTLLIVSGLIATYILVKRRKSNVILETMHFQNPSFGLSHIENNYQNDLDRGNRFENPAAKIIQQTEGKLGMLFRGKKADSKEKPRNVDYDSDSDNYERTDMKANLIR